MSGPKTAGYAVSEAQRALMAAAQRQQQARRRWELAVADRERLRAEATTIGRRYGIEVPAIPSVGGPPGVDADTVDRVRAGVSDQTRALREALVEAASRGAAARARANAVGLGSHGRAERVTATTFDAVRPVPSRSATGPASDVPAEPPTAAPDTLAADLAEADRLVARLPYDVEPPPTVTDLVGAVATAPPDRRRVLLALLRQHVTKAREAASARRDAAGAIAEADLVARDTGDEPLARAVAAARAQTARGHAVDTAALRDATVAAEARQRTDMEREHVRQAVVEAFVGRGYTVLPAAEVLTPVEGVLVRRGPSSRHAVRLTVDGSAIRLEPVRVGAPGEPPGVAGDEAARAADVRAEQELCEDVPHIAEELAVNGVRIGRIVGAAAGALPQPWIEVSTATPARGAERAGQERAVSKEQGRRRKPGAPPAARARS
ncbi:hypothetical protein [Micromonospora tulbaghiae]